MDTKMSTFDELLFTLLVYVKKFLVKKFCNKFVTLASHASIKIKHQGRDCCANTTEKSRADLIGSGAGFQMLLCFFF